MIIDYSVAIWCSTLVLCFVLLFGSIILYFRREKYPINKSFIIIHLTRAIYSCIILVCIVIVHTIAENVFLGIIIKSIIIFSMPMIHLVDIFNLVQIIVKMKYIYAKSQISRMFGKYLSRERIREINIAMMSTRSRRIESISKINEYPSEKTISTNKGEIKIINNTNSDLEIYLGNKKNKIGPLKKLNIPKRSNKNKIQKNEEKKQPHVNSKSPEKITSPRIDHINGKSLVFRITKKIMTEKYIFFQMITWQFLILIIWLFGVCIILASSNVNSSNKNNTIEEYSKVVHSNIYLYETSFFITAKIIFIGIKFILLSILMKVKYQKWKRIKIFISCIVWAVFSLCAFILDILTHYEKILKLRISWSFSIITCITYFEVFITVFELLIVSCIKKEIKVENITIGYNIVDNDAAYKELFKFASKEHNIEQISFIRYARKIKKMRSTQRKASTRKLHDTYLIKGRSPLELNMTRESVPYIRDIENYLAGLEDFPSASIDHLILIAAEDTKDLFSRFCNDGKYKDIMESDSIKIKIN